MRRVLARFRQRTLLGLPAPDVALAALLCAIAVMSVLTGNPDEGPMALTLPVALVSTLALAWRRRLPLVMIGLVAVCGYVAIVVVNSAWLWPILTGQLITYQDWQSRIWFPSWI